MLGRVAAPGPIYAAPLGSAETGFAAGLWISGCDGPTHPRFRVPGHKLIPGRNARRLPRSHAQVSDAVVLMRNDDVNEVCTRMHHLKTVTFDDMNR